MTAKRINWSKVLKHLQETDTSACNCEFCLMHENGTVIRFIQKYLVK